MYLDTYIKAECCGCSACEQVCSKKCIIMEKDEEGFSYPFIKYPEQCVKCGLCSKVCPIASPSIYQDNIDLDNIWCYYGWNKNAEIRRESTSGAAFYSIALSCLETGYDKVYGAVMEDGFVVYHKAASSKEELKDLIGSKYVQSNTQNIFLEVLSELKSGEKVVFSGSPCQVDGLLHFIPSILRENLLTIALVCHGTACPEVFSNYIAEIGKEKSVISYKFRDKQCVNGVLSQKYTTINFENGKNISRLRDPYVVAFGQGLFTRESCIECKYTTPNRKFDITIGDFWGLLSYRPELSDEVEKGISLIICHSSKGLEAIQRLDSMFLERVPVAYAVNPIQQQLIKPLERNPFRYDFLTTRHERHIVRRINASIVKYNIYFFLIRCWRKVKHFIPN